MCCSSPQGREKCAQQHVDGTCAVDTAGLLQRLFRQLGVPCYQLLVGQHTAVLVLCSRTAAADREHFLAAMQLQLDT
jgi:hypothetical protein